MSNFSHLNDQNEPLMVNVSAKIITQRTARAQAIVVLNDEILSHFEHDDIKTKKGAVFQIAIIAGIMAAKKTGDLIPLCHPLGLENCQIDVFLNKKREVEISCTASLTGKTGVEMEALTGATIAALTVYDMCKVFSHDIEIKSVRLMEKTGGKRDFKRN